MASERYVEGASESDGVDAKAFFCGKGDVCACAWFANVLRCMVFSAGNSNRDASLCNKVSHSVVWVCRCCCMLARLA